MEHKTRGHRSEEPLAAQSHSAVEEYARLTLVCQTRQRARMALKSERDWSNSPQRRQIRRRRSTQSRPFPSGMQRATRAVGNIQRHPPTYVPGHDIEKSLHQMREAVIDRTARFGPAFSKLLTELINPVAGRRPHRHCRGVYMGRSAQSLQHH